MRIAMTPALVAEMNQVATQVAAAYCRRCWWADSNDLIQEAWAHAIMPALRTYSPEHAGDDGLRGYIARACLHVMGKHIFRTRRPASCSRSVMPSIRAVPIDEISSMHDPAPLPDELVDRKRWVEDARRAIDRALSSTPNASLAEDLIRKDVSAGDAADLYNLPRTRVYRMRTRAAAELASSRGVRAAYAAISR